MQQVTREQMMMEFDYTLSLNEASLPGMDKMITTCSSAMEAIKDAHAIAVMTEWDEFATLDFQVTIEA